MQRLATLLTIASFISVDVFAQNDDTQKFQRFGFTAGVNYSTMKFNSAFPSPNTSGKINGKPGFLIGFILRVPLTKRLTLQPEYIYSVRSAEVANTHTTFKLNYFSTPLLLAYQVTNRFSVVAGPQVDILLKARSDTGSVSKDIIHETEERSIGLTIGAIYKITKSLQVEAQYYHGLNHIGIENNTTEFSYRVFRLNASVSF